MHMPDAYTLTSVIVKSNANVMCRINSRWKKKIAIKDIYPKNYIFLGFLFVCF